MKRFDQINVIPFIDIMLVLLAIVLTTASFISQGILDIELPEAKSAAPHPDEVTTRISIKPDGSVFLDDKSVTLENLAAELEKADKQTPFLLEVDKQARFEAFVSVIDLLKQNALSNLSIMAETGS